MTLDDFFSRLQGVKRRGQDKYVACCPAHDDKDPSLSLTERDGRILLHCWAGCSALSVVEALGLSLSDLFTREDHPPMAFAMKEFAARRRRESELDKARLVIALAESDRQRGLKQSLEDRKRELEAVKVLVLAGVEYDPEIVLMNVRI